MDITELTNSLRDVVAKAIPDERTHCGCLVGECFNNEINRNKVLPKLRPLIPDIPNLYANEVTILFGDTAVCKSVFATQIGIKVAETGMKVANIDCELSSRQATGRYIGEDGTVFRFPDNYHRFEVEYENIPDNEDIGVSIVKSIRALAVTQDFKFFVVDNLSVICGDGEKGDVARGFMLAIRQLKVELGLTFLVVAHTPKRDLSTRLNENLVAGSKKFANFADALLAIGKSSQNKNYRYVKELKTRNDVITWGDDSVAVFEVTKGENGNFLHLEFVGTSPEDDHLLHVTQAQKEENLAKIQELINRGYSNADIVRNTGIADSTLRYNLRSGKLKDSRKTLFDDGI